MGTEEIVRRGLHSDRRIIPASGICVSLEGDSLVLEGEVETLAAKKLALECAAALAPDASGIVDRLHVAPAQVMGDGEICDHVRAGLCGEPALGGIGPIGVAVQDGVVTLDGEVPSLSHKRLAGALAWWVPGTRDVVNGLGVVPPEADNEGEVTDAVRLVLERDPLVDAASIGVRTSSFIVHLAGVVRSDWERSAAEFDAWCVFGVNEVVNHLTVAATH
jgi:osmotically-inducible protein OsmY